MNREITIDNNTRRSVARDGIRIMCAFDLEQECVATCAAYEDNVTTRKECMCNRGNFMIGYNKE